MRICNMTLFEMSCFVVVFSFFFTVYSRPAGKFHYLKYGKICVISGYICHRAKLF